MGSVHYHINLNVFHLICQEKIKIAIWEAELVFSADFKSDGTSQGSYGGQGGLLWELRVGGGPR